MIREHQARLLESPLTLASSEAGLHRREPVDLAAVTEQTLAASQAELDRRGLRLSAEVAPAWTVGHAALVERLVDNAMGYNRSGGEVTVNCLRRGGQAVVRVANTEAAIPAEQVNRLFEPFQRLDRAGEREGHHGLGLSIVRAIANALDATIEAMARAEGGLRIEVSFPAATEPSDLTDLESDTGARPASRLASRP